MATDPRRPNPVLPAGDPVVPMPAYHERAMQYMRARPGTTYDDACAIARGDGPVIDPTAKPFYHDRAMEHLFAHPGCTYEQAVAHVTSGRR